MDLSIDGFDVKNYVGTIIKFNKEKGFGFIISKDINSEIFFHFSAIENGTQSTLYQLLIDQTRNNSIVKPPIEVSFRLFSDDRGIRAVQLRFSEEYASFARIDKFLSSAINNEEEIQDSFIDLVSMKLLNEIHNDNRLGQITLQRIIKSSAIYDSLISVSLLWQKILSYFDVKRIRTLSSQDIELLNSFIQKISFSLRLYPKKDVSIYPDIPAFVQPLNNLISPLKLFIEVEEISLIIFPNHQRFLNSLHSNPDFVKNSRKKFNLILIMENVDNSLFDFDPSINITFINQRQLIKSIIDLGKETPIVVGQLLRKTLPKRLIQSEKMLQPYDTGVTYKDYLFVGRSNERLRILSDRTSNFAFYGGRRIGKTWLALDICNSCKKDEDYKNIYHAFYVSMQSATNLDRAVNLIIEKINFDLNIESAAIDPLTKLGNVLIKTHRVTGKTILLVLDELDDFLQVDGHYLLFERLRQLQSTYNFAFKYIFVGFKDLIRIFHENTVDNPFFHWIGDNHFSLGFLSEEDLRTMISLIKWAGIEYDENETLNTIYNLTSGHPYYTQALCSKIVDTKIKQNSYSLTVSHIQKLATEEFLDAIFDTFQRNLSNLQRLIGKIFTLQDKSYSEQEIMEILKTKYSVEISPKSLHEQMEVLQACSIFTRDFNGYHPVVQWINQKYFSRFDDVDLTFVYMANPNA